MGLSSGFHSDRICSESRFGNIPEMVGESCVPLQNPFLPFSYCQGLSFFFDHNQEPAVQFLYCMPPHFTLVTSFPLADQVT